MKTWNGKASSGKASSGRKSASCASWHRPSCSRGWPRASPPAAPAGSRGGWGRTASARPAPSAPSAAPGSIPVRSSGRTGRAPGLPPTSPPSSISFPPPPSTGVACWPSCGRRSNSAAGTPGPCRSPRVATCLSPHSMRRCGRGIPTIRASRRAPASPWRTTAATGPRPPRRSASNGWRSAVTRSPSRCRARKPRSGGPNSAVHGISSPADSARPAPPSTPTRSCRSIPGRCAGSKARHCSPGWRRAARLPSAPPVRATSRASPCARCTTSTIRPPRA